MLSHMKLLLSLKNCFLVFTVIRFFNPIKMYNQVFFLNIFMQAYNWTCFYISLRDIIFKYVKN